MLDPDMPAEQLRLHMGELTAQEVRTARAAIRWANTQAVDEVERLRDACEVAAAWISDGGGNDAAEADAIYGVLSGAARGSGPPIAAPTAPADGS